jgi:hypothetical protein
MNLTRLLKEMEQAKFRKRDRMQMQIGEKGRHFSHSKTLTV